MIVKPVSCNMDFLKNINWHDHDGVNLAMINDFARNQFYDTLLKQRVGNKDCVEIGFGTGLLSLVALKHGAKSIVAYESDSERFLLGQLIINELKLADRITLINQRYNSDTLNDHPGVNTVFTETVAATLWPEGLYTTLPRKPGVDFLPSQYFLEVVACVIPESFAQGLQLSKTTDGFNPGIDIDDQFVDIVNRIGFPEYTKPTLPTMTEGITYFDHQQQTQWGWMSYLKKSIAHGDVVASYCIDALSSKIVTVDKNNVDIRDINFDLDKKELVVDTSIWQNETVLIVPRVGMAHDKQRLTLDNSCWGPADKPILLHKAKTDLIITHNFYNGNIDYNLI